MKTSYPELLGKYLRKDLPRLSLKQPKRKEANRMSISTDIISNCCSKSKKSRKEV